MQFKHVTLDFDGPVAILKLDHQEVMNAVSMDMLGGLGEAFPALQRPRRDAILQPPAPQIAPARGELIGDPSPGDVGQGGRQQGRARPLIAKRFHLPKVKNLHRRGDYRGRAR